MSASKKILFLSLSAILFTASRGQELPLGQWRNHFSFTQCVLCETSKEFIYTASGRGFFKTDVNTFEMTRLSSLDGFHGKEITNLAFYPEKNILLIGYADGYI